MALPQYFLQELKGRSDITDIVSAYVNLKRSGKNMVGLCPFHNEKTPSFNVYTENGSFYCFGCNTGGDVITFIMQIENLDYIEAVKFLAQRSGLNMPEDGVDDSMSKMRGRILEINRSAAKFFHKTLYEDAGRKGLDYCRRRDLDDNTIRRFGLGYAPDGGFALTNHLTNNGYSKEELTLANVAGSSRNGNLYDRFRARLMIPIIDLRGNVVAFGGRIMTDEKPKYINTSDTPVYHKSSALYAMNFAKNSGKRQLILAEGYMDVIALHRAGFENTIASLGTSLTEEQARIIARYSDEVVICYDGDEAGQRATQRAIPILKKSGLFVKVLALPGNKDPDDFLRANGKDGPLKFKAMLEKSNNDVEYRLEKIRSDYDIDTNEGKIKYLQEAVKVLAQLSDKIARDVFTGMLSQQTGVERKSIQEMTDRNIKSNYKQIKRTEEKKQREFSTAKSTVNKEKSKNFKVANAEEGIIAFLFQNPDKISEMGRRIPAEKFITAFNRRVYGILMGKTIYNEISLSDFSAELTGEEMSELAKILFDNQRVVGTWEDVLDKIDIVLNGAVMQNPEQLKAASEDEIREQLQKLRRKKQGDDRNGNA